jgi:selenocysteine lyase/cysteine desulfurase
MTSTSSNRRNFLSALSATFIASLTQKVFPQPSGGHPERNTETEDYLFSPGLIYFGTATIGPCPRKIVEESMRAWYELETSPTAMAYSTDGTLALAERTRQSAADFLGCSVDEIAITRSTTDGMNAIAQGLRLASGHRVITTDQEHEGGSMCWQYLAKYHGILIDTIVIPPGENNVRAILDRITSVIKSGTRVISISHVLPSTGLRMPIAEISALAKSRGILCVVDGAQAVGAIDTNVKSLGCHAYATSGHKWLMAPKGTGLLYISRDVDNFIQPMQFLDGRAYYNHSTGVGNLPGAVGLGAALESMKAKGIQTIEQHNVGLRNRIYDGLMRIKKTGVVSASPGLLATPLVTFKLPQEIDSQVLAKTLQEKYRIIVKVVPKRWLNGIRLSPHIFNTEQEVDQLLSALRAELA